MTWETIQDVPKIKNFGIEVLGNYEDESADNVHPHQFGHGLNIEAVRQTFESATQYCQLLTCWGYINGTRRALGYMLIQKDDEALGVFHVLMLNAVTGSSGIGDMLMVMAKKLVARQICLDSTGMLQLASIHAVRLRAFYMKHGFVDLGERFDSDQSVETYNVIEYQDALAVIELGESGSVSDGGLAAKVGFLTAPDWLYEMSCDVAGLSKSSESLDRKTLPTLF